MGGDRLGSGAGMDVNLKTYNRSNHNLSTTVKTTMAAGTLVPFLNLVGLPGDTFDIDLDAMVFTKPTVGPLFDTYKLQIDVFSTAWRLYLPLLHNNPTMVGLNMDAIKLPQLHVTGKNPVFTEEYENSQIEPSCVLKYLGISGIGKSDEEEIVERQFNAMGFLALWDIYKNYYANKQEEIGAVIHQVPNDDNGPEVYDMFYQWIEGPTTNTVQILKKPSTGTVERHFDGEVKMYYNNNREKPDLNNIKFTTDEGELIASEMFLTVDYEFEPGTEQYTAWFRGEDGTWSEIINYDYVTADEQPLPKEPQVYTFPLENIDTMRNKLLANIMSPTAYIIDRNEIAPYGLPLGWTSNDLRYATGIQEGLPLKTYQSDQFQNWMSTDWITEINNRSTIDVTGGLTMDAFAMMKNVWVLLNRVAMADGSYKSWIDTVYTASGKWRAETPIFEGGLSKEIIFDEVISNAEATNDGVNQPLGTLAGRGRLGGKHKGGKIVIKADEVIQITGIASITPRIGYSQGNVWDVNLKTMDDLHKPQLDGIGFQDLLTDWLAWWDTDAEYDTEWTPVFKSAGKQPAWMNYRTNVDRNYGNFAKPEEMFMTLNRRYEADPDGDIVDLTTYIDPKKYNYVFAETDRSAQNFWVQIKADIKARRVMSTSVIPNI